MTTGRKPRGTQPLAFIHALEPRCLLAAVPFDGFVAPADARLGPAVQLGDVAYFFSVDSSATGGNIRAELWKTDGTPTGTVPTGVSFPNAGQVPPTSLVVFNGKLLFDANDLQLGTELWVSDGTPGGTVRASNFAGDGAQPRDLTVVGDQAFFTLQEADTGRELWRTDGTPAGTRLVVDLQQGSTSSTPALLTPFNNRLYFTATGAAEVRGLWSTDGTAAGTGRVIQLGGGATPSLATALHVGPTPAGQRLFFGANPGGTTSGTELWATDGSAGGTYLVKDINPIGASSTPSEFATFNGAVYFAAYEPATGREIWRTDGTADGTTRVIDTWPGVNSINPAALTPVGGRLFFTGSMQASGLWSTDGTAGGTRQVAMPVRDIFYSIRDLRAVGDRLFFVPMTQTLGEEPWVSDGTDAGTFLLSDVTPGPADSRPVALANVGGKLVFAAHEPLTGAAPWVTDGTPDGTTLLRRTAGDQPLNVSRLVASGDKLYAFGTYPSAHFAAAMRGLWVTDGTVGGTRMLYARRDSFFADPEYVRPADGKLFFGGRNVWASDGTPAGTRQVHPGQVPNTQLETGRLHQTAVVGGVFYFAVDTGFGPQELWKSDGTPAGTVRVKVIGNAEVEGRPGYFRALGDKLIFTAFDPATGPEPWVSDGTEQGTFMLKDVAPGPAGSGVGDMVYATPAGGKLFFLAYDGAHGAALWSTDGTPAGTQFVKDLDPGSTSPESFRTVHAALGDALYFSGPGPGNAIDLWRTFGTAAGTQVALPATNPLTLTAWRGSLYFPVAAGAQPPLTPNTFYRSDGTPAGTVPLRTFLPDPAVSSPKGAVAADDGVYFTARSETGRDLWKTDGTPQGTVLVHDTPGSTDPSSITPFSGSVWFSVDGKVWVTQRERAVVARHVFYNNSSADGGDPAANASDDAAIDRTKRVLVPGARATTFNTTSYSRGINGLMIDLGAAGASVAADDFELHVGNGSTWTPLSATPGVAIRRGAGVNATDRVTLTLPDGLVKNTWLRVTVRATTDTGLASPDVFYVGNLVGDVGGNPGGFAAVDRTDLARVRARLGSTGGAARALFDVNRDGVVNAADYHIVRLNQGRRLAFFAAPDAP